jgi:serine protease
MRSLIIKASHFLILSAILLQTACSGGSSSPTKEGSATFTLSGAIAINSRSDVDADVMISGGLQEQNNLIESPQELSNPVTLGGYLSGNEGTYNTGANYEKDTKDFFRVNLLKGQEVRVTTFLANDDLTSINISFTLHALDDELNEFGTTPLIFNGVASQAITAPKEGGYIIELSAQDGASSPLLYTLTVSQTFSASSTTLNLTASQNAPFVPGEVVVQFKNKNSIQASYSSYKHPQKNQKVTNFQHKYQLLHKKNIGTIGQVFKINTATNVKILAFEANIAGTPQASELNKKWQTLNAIEQLNADGDVLFAEPNYLFTASAVPPKVNDPGFARQWNLSMIDAPAAWEASTGEGVTIAVIDSGIDTNHLDLVNNINFTDGYDFIIDDASANDDEPGPDNNPHDTGTLLHGSHVAGIIAAQGDNSIGIAGIAYNTIIMPLRALGVENNGTNSDIASAILYAAGLPNASGLTPTKKADIINLSLGGTAIPALLKNAIEKALAQGIIVIAAAGNESSSTPHYPAAFEGVIAVSSVNEHKVLSNFSNYGPHIDVTAPGGTSVNNPLFDGFQDGILSTLYANEYAQYTGTSMATPHVAAVAALMKSINRELTNTTFEEALNNGDLTAALSNTDFYGNGLISAAKAVNWALESQAENILSASLSLYPKQLGFIDANTESTLELNNPGSGSLTVTQISTTNDWIEIAEFQAGSVNASKLGKYRIKVNNTGLAPNTIKSGEITVNYKINDIAEEPIVIDVFNSSNQQTDSTIGSLFVSLSYIDEDAPIKPLVQFALVEAIKGDDQYTYNFFNVPNGSYLLQAGTNNDLDSSIMDAGEATGQYPHFTQAEFIKVDNEDLINLNFSVQNQNFVQPTP